MNRGSLRGRGLLWPVIEINIAPRRGRFAETTKFANQAVKGVAVIQVIGNNSFLELRFLGRLPLDSPRNAVQSRCVSRGPRRAKKISKRLQRIRSTWKIDLAVNQLIDVYETLPRLGAC